MVAASVGASTSTPDSQYQDCEVTASVNSAAPVKSPGAEIQLVCRPREWTLAGPVSAGTYTLTASSPSGAMSRATGSLSISAPGGIVTDPLPLNMRVRSEPGAIAESLLRSPACAAPITRGVD